MGEPGAITRRQFIAGVSLGALAGFGAGAAVTRRLLLAGSGSGGFTLPGDLSIALTSAGNGGWNQQSDYKAAYYNGTTYVAWIDSSGNVEIASYDHATETVSATTTLHAGLTVDVHTSPSIHIRDSDRRIMVFYSEHNGAAMYQRISTNAEDISAFETEVNLDSTFGGSQYTYPTIFQQLGQTGDPVVLFYRDRPGGGSDTALCYSYTTDHDTSPTWNAQTQLMLDTAQFYWKASCDGDIRIDVIATDGHPTTDAPTRLLHMYSFAADWHKSDGTTLTGMPFAPSELTEIDDGTNGSCWPMGVVKNGGNPVCVYWRGTYGSGAMDIVYARWNGSAWVKTVIVANGGPGAYAPGGAVIDEADPDTVYVSRWNGDRYAMFRYVTADNGATFSLDGSLDYGQTDDTLWPGIVRNGVSPLKVVWLRGTITDENTYTLDVAGGA